MPPRQDDDLLAVDCGHRAWQHNQATLWLGCERFYRAFNFLSLADSIAFHVHSEWCPYLLDCTCPGRTRRVVRVYNHRAPDNGGCKLPEGLRPFFGEFR